MSKRFEGYYRDDELPLKDGDIVTILKGTRIKTTMPRAEDKVRYAKRTYKVRINHLLNGTTITIQNRGRDFDLPLGPLTNPSVRWGGTGGYWFSVDINDIPEAQPQEGNKHSCRREWENSFLVDHEVASR